MNQILITGATGRIGREVVSQLVASSVRVRALARDPDAARLPREVEVVEGNLTDPASLGECLEGVDSVFLVWTAPAETASAAIARIAERARRVVLLTSPHQIAHPFFRQPNPLAVLHAELERLVKASVPRWTILRPGMFAANALSWWAQQIHDGDAVRWPYADAATAPIHERDIAAVAVCALLTEGLDRAEYVLTGPESLTQREQVATIGSVIGRRLRFEEISPERARSELAFPEGALNMLLNAWAASIGLPALVTNTVAEVTGMPPRTFHDWVIDHAEGFGAKLPQRQPN